jgi:peptidoglycan/LPS O-acetylase OafA/YrhL
MNTVCVDLRTIPAIERYRPGSHVDALDGIRGLAILLVVIFHSSCFCPPASAGLGERLYYQLVSVGWCGVDLFFVLSGFLITGILLDSRDGEGYFRNFYARRVLRIFPLFYGCLLVTYSIGPFVVNHVYGMDWLIQKQLWFWFYMQNWLFAFQSYPSPNYMGHFWSLAIEEQFYLAWPFVVFVLSTKSLRRLCVVLFVLSLILRMFFLLYPGLGKQTHGIVRYVTFTRLDGLVVGAMLASWVRTDGLLPVLYKRAWAVFGVGAGVFGAICVVALIFHSLFLLDLVGFTVLAVLFGGLLTLAITRPAEHLIVRIFSSRPLRFMGKISYAMYVFHNPVMISLGNYWKSLKGGVFDVPLVRQLSFLFVTGILTILAGVVSWHLFEKRFLELKKYFVASKRR